jgi:hypothetical protein
LELEEIETGQWRILKIRKVLRDEDAAAVAPVPGFQKVGHDLLDLAEDIAEVDNQAFAIILFNWLAECGPVPAEKTTWGKFKALYRDATR